MGYEARRNKALRALGITEETRNPHTRPVAGTRLVSTGDAAGWVTSRDGRTYYFDGISLRRMARDRRKAA
jgi:hypothetical protein